MSTLITAGQLKRLQTLYGHACAHTQQGHGRSERLEWASHFAGRPIASFSDLTTDEARRMIDALQGQLGVRQPARKRCDRDAARRRGLDGRHDGQEFAAAPRMVSAEDLASLQSYYERLGWDRARFDAWLRSSSSPIKRADPVIRTEKDANRVRWALKRMLQREGLWEERRPA